MLDARAQGVWRTLTGDVLTQAPFWQDYREHVERRNAIAHKGQRISAPEGSKSVAVARDFMAHIKKHTNAIVGPGW
jgi:hypothetical protein